MRPDWKYLKSCTTNKKVSLLINQSAKNFTLTDGLVVDPYFDRHHTWNEELQGCSCAHFWALCGEKIRSFETIYKDWVTSDLPFYMCDQCMSNVTIVGRCPLCGIGGAKLSETLFGNVRVEDSQIRNVKNHIGHGALAQISRCKWGHHENTGIFCKSYGG